MRKLPRTNQKWQKTGVVTDFTVHSIIVIMYNLNRLKELKIFLSSLTAYKGPHICHTTITDEINAVETALMQKLDMDDAIQYSSALTLQAEAIISFDKHFNSLKIYLEKSLNRQNSQLTR
jgi:predicted nucleic acid-binding protein